LRLEVHVPSIDQIPDARTAAEAVMQSGDELEIIVDTPTPTPASIQERKPAGAKV
jgi:hypothetical protein